MYDDKLVLLKSDPWQPILKLHSRDAPSHSGVHVAAAAHVPIAFTSKFEIFRTGFFCTVIDSVERLFAPTLLAEFDHF